VHGFQGGGGAQCIDCRLTVSHRPMEIRVIPRGLRCLVASLAHRSPSPSRGSRGHEKTGTKTPFPLHLPNLAAAPPLQAFMEQLHKSATKGVETACKPLGSRG